jgi:CheY-like chemotaxis protein
MVGTLAGTAVLLADDDADNLELLQFVFEQEGAAVRGASSGKEVLALLRDWKPDILLLDISLPDLDGYELLGRVREDPAMREVPAIAITGRAYARDKQRAAEAGFVVHVTKPFDHEALIHVVMNLVAKPAESATQAEFRRILREEGFHAALGVVNQSGAHRFTGMYRFDGDMLRNVHLFDRANPTVRRGDDAPLAETYCSLVGAARGPFVTTDAEADPRLLEHPARLCVRSYCGALLRHADATPFGTVCSFDVVSQPAPDELVTLLQLVAPILGAEIDAAA